MTYERSMRESGEGSATSTHPGLGKGWPVYTADGEKLGTVKEVAAASFKVDAPMRPDYWLGTSCVSAAAPERVELAFPKERLADYKLHDVAENDVVGD